MNRKNLGRLRVSGGYAGLAMLAIAAMLTIAPYVFAAHAPLMAIGHEMLSQDVAAEAPQLTTHNLSYANQNGFTTTLVVTNPTGQDIDVARPNCKVAPCIVDRFYAYDTKHTLNWPRPGVDMQLLTTDARLIVYVQHETLLGTITRIGSLKHLDSATFYDLPDFALRQVRVARLYQGREGDVRHHR